MSFLITTFLSFLCLAWLSACAEEGISSAAREQIGVTVNYDPAYVVLDYPSGDIPRSSGVCTDVLIRALRDAKGADLQVLVHQDMRANFAKYPKRWGLTRPDRNIDHRRVPNLRTYLERHHISFGKPTRESTFEAGDIVTCLVGGRLPHVMIVSDKMSAAGLPLVIHNIGSGTREEDALFDFVLTGHYRWQEAE